MKVEKEISRWQKTIQDLKGQADGASARVDRLTTAKKPITLTAMTGDAKAKAKLAEINAEIRGVEQEAADIAEAIAQAESKLSEAETQKAKHDEAVRLKAVRDIAEKQVALGEKVEAAAKELAGVCEEFRRAGFEMGQVGGWPVGDRRWERADGSGRLLLCLQTHLSKFMDTTLDRRHPNFGQPLSEVERQALSQFLLTDKGVEMAADHVANRAA